MNLELWNRVPPQWREPVMAAGLAVGVVVAMQLIVRPSWGYLQRQRQALREVRAQMDNADAMRSRGTDGAQSAALQGRYAELALRLDSSQSVARVLDVLNAQARERQLEFSAQQSRSQTLAAHAAPWGAGPSVEEIPLALRLTGRYKSMGEFLGWLSEAPFVAAVRSVEMRKVEGAAAQLEAEVMLIVYVREKASS
jgi:Tfp pilus assembly protein PilO